MSTTSAATAPEASIKFDNLLLRRLPVDPVEGSARRQVKNAMVSRVKPTPLTNPRLMACSDDALRLVGLSEHQVRSSPTEFAALLAGNTLFDGSDPYANCYCGHQFGSWAGQLGDGRAISLGESVTAEHGRWELQLKGAGQTPYSRFADGRAVLRSSIREFLCSEHMAALGVPTTRAMSLVVGDDRVVRDPMYDGRAIQEQCAVVARLAPTLIRFGSFEVSLPANGVDRDMAGPSVGNVDMMKQLLDVTIEEHYKELLSEVDEEERYALFYREVVKRTAKLVALWQCVGFTHGVLNTDNMSVLGLTIDYGPFGFMDHFNPRFVPNHSDDRGRYCYENQPGIGAWNLNKFGEALGVVISRERLTKEFKDNYVPTYQAAYLSTMRRKLGLLRKELPEDEDLVADLMKTMAQVAGDFTNSFRILSEIDPLGGADTAQPLPLLALLAQTGTLEDIQRATGPEVPRESLMFYKRMEESDPEKYRAVLGKSLAAFEEQYRLLLEADKLAAMSPEEKLEREKGIWSPWLVKYQQRLAIDLEGAEDAAESAKARVETMNVTNPKYILRNYLLQRAIEGAEKGDTAELDRLMRVAIAPFSDHPDLAEFDYDSKRPETAAGFVLSCSS